MAGELLERLLENVHGVLSEFGDSTLRVTVTDRAESALRFQIRQRISLVPALTGVADIPIKLLRRGKKHRSADDAVAAARIQAAEAADGLVGSTEAAMHPAPDHADGSTTVWTAPNADTFMTACARCSGKGKLTCSNCKGRATVKCPSCGGSGKNVCGMCGGLGNQQRSQLINGNYVTDYVMCASCVGSGQQNCFS